ncbi:MAG: J domain-containing protein [Nitrospira sp.]|nr:MAG: J domain-containing protein [Nitrospira sp.]
MPFSQSKFIRFQNGMRKRIDSLRPKAEESLNLAVDTMMQERVDSFFRVEQGLEEVIKSLIQIEGEIRERPRRRRKKISLADMLKAAGGGGGDLSQGSSGINNAMDAYAAMGVEFGSSLADVTASFRHKAKQLHPDSNNGDRSAEPELRRMLEAYQFLKEYLSLSNVEPPRSPDATYRPTE